MDILVLVKQVPGDLAGVAMTPSNTVDRAVGQTVTDPVDKNALEAAVELATQTAGTVTVLTMGPASAKAVLKECVSLGAHRGVHVADESLVGSDAWTTARVLAAATSATGSFDLVLAGVRSLDGGSGAVPVMVAEILGLPQVTNVTGIELADAALECSQVVEGGHDRVRVELPALVTVDEYINTPRYPSIKSKLAANKATFTVLTATDLGVDDVGLDAAATVVAEVAAPPAREPGTLIAGSSAEEIADKLVAALAGADVL